MSLAPGAGLLLHTDGLTEARTRGGDLFGERRLASFLASRSGPEPIRAATLVADLVGLLDRLSGGVRDDVALLALSVPA